MGLKVLLSCCVSDTNDMTRNSLAYVILMHAVSVASSLFYSEKQSHTQKSRHGYIIIHYQVHPSVTIAFRNCAQDSSDARRLAPGGSSEHLATPTASLTDQGGRLWCLALQRPKSCEKPTPQKSWGSWWWVSLVLRMSHFFLIWWRFFFVIFVLFASSTLAIEQEISSFWWDGWCPDPRQYAASRIQVCLIRASIFTYIFLIDMFHCRIYRHFWWLCSRKVSLCLAAHLYDSHFHTWSHLAKLWGLWEQFYAHGCHEYLLCRWAYWAWFSGCFSWLLKPRDLIQWTPFWECQNRYENIEYTDPEIPPYEHLQLAGHKCTLLWSFCDLRMRMACGIPRRYGILGSWRYSLSI